MVHNRTHDPSMLMLRTLLTLSLVGASSCGLTGHAPPAPDPVDARLSQVAWFVGAWRMQQEGGYVEESWLPPSGTAMLGVGSTVKHGKTVAFEFLRIEARAEGLVYIAQPGGRSPGTEFVATLLTGDEARSENPEHDFPTWILYRRTGPETCVATIGDAEDRFELAYRRKEGAQ